MKITQNVALSAISVSRTVSTTIPNLLTKHRGNQSKVSKILNVNRSTVRKYAHDTHGHHHIVRLYWSQEVDLPLGLTVEDVCDFTHAQLLVATCGRKEKTNEESKA